MRERQDRPPALAAWQARRGYAGPKFRPAANAWPDLLNLTVRWHQEFIGQRSTGESNPLNSPAFPVWPASPRCARLA
jgi:hypothetical protein